MAASSAACAPAFCADMSLGGCSGSWDEIDRRSGRDELFFLGAVLELPNDSLRVLHHPPAHVPLANGFSFFRVLHEVRNAGKAQRQLRVVKVLLALEIDLEVFPFDGMQLVLEPDHAGFAIGGFPCAQKERTL